MIKDGISRIFWQLSSRLFTDDGGETIETPEVQLVDEVDKAYQEWIDAQKYFQGVSEPALVDHAIFMEEAARRKYIYLLNIAKNEGIRIEEPK